MFVVKRPFKSLGVVYTAGTEISDPAVIKHFKSRLGAGDIIVVTEQNYDTCRAYFKTKHGVDIEKKTVKEEPKAEGPKVEEPKAVKAEAKPVAKAIVK